MKVLLSGYFGYGNIGDEAILEAEIVGLREKYPRADIIVLSSSPSATARRYGVRSVNRLSLRQIRRAVSECDILISGGGGLIQDVTGFLTIPYYLGIIYLAMRRGKPTVIFGQGFGPVRNPLNRLLVRWMLNRVDLIILRDEKSSVEMIKLGVKKPPIHVAGDLTPNLPLPDPGKSGAILEAEGIAAGEKPLVGISIRRPAVQLPRHKAESYYRTIADVSDHIIEKLGAKLVFIPFHYPTDIVESSKIINLMKNPVNIILRDYIPEEILGIVSRMDLFIGMRLHSLIFSAMASVPMVGISYDPKVDNFLEFVSQKRLDVMDVEKASLVRIIEDAWAGREQQKSRLSQKARELNLKARLNFEILDAFIRSSNAKNILGVDFSNVSCGEALDMAEGFIRSGSPNLIVTPNPEIVVSCERNEDLRRTINSASLRLPDGVGIIWASRLLRRPLKERVTGIDFMIKLASLCERKKLRVFLLGSSPGIAEGAGDRLKQMYPGINVVGTYYGYFSKEEEAGVIENISSLKPDVVFVGMGSPAQELWASGNLRKLGASIVMTVGGSMDVLSGKTRRAPGIFRSMCLEWLYRLIREPWRIGRQAALVKFVLRVIYTRLFIRPSKNML